MLTNDILKKITVILIIFSVFVFGGCKGKEQKQTPESVSTSQSSESIQKLQEEPSDKTTIPSESSQEIQTATTPRIVSLDLLPRIPVVGDTLKAIVKTNIEDVTIHYQWSLNEEVLPNETDSLLLSPNMFKRGDKIKLRITPESSSLKGAPMTVVITIGNAAPIIKSSKESINFDGSTYTYQVKAYDPDGDKLYYSLIRSPQGMKIDSTGFVEWVVPNNFKGPVSFTISVSDGQGGETLQSFNLDIR